MSGSSSTASTLTLPGIYVIRPFQGKPLGKLARVIKMTQWGYHNKLVNGVLAVLVAIPMFSAGFCVTRASALIITNPIFRLFHPTLAQNLPEYFLAGAVLAAMGLVFLVRHSEEEPSWVTSLFLSTFGGLVVGFTATYPL